MKFIVDKENFLNGLRIVEKITVQRGIQPVLANFLLETDEDKIIFSSTDYDNSVKTSALASVEEDGKITLPAKKLLDIIARMPDDKPITFDMPAEKTSVIIKSGKSKFEIVGISASEFPEIIKDEYLKSENSIKIETAPFIKAIKKCTYCAENNESRSVLSGVNCVIKNNELEMVATDGNRLAKYNDILNSKDGIDNSVIFPVKPLLEFSRIVQITEDSFLELIINESNVVFKTDKFILCSNKKQGNFPAYEQIIPQNCPKEAVIDRQTLCSALERVEIMDDSRIPIIKFNFNAGVLTLTADVPNEGTAEETIDIEYDAEELNIAFNSKYVLDAVKSMDEEKVVIKMTMSNTASIFKPYEKDNYLCLIMPVEIK